MDYFVHIGDERLHVSVKDGALEVDGTPMPVEVLGRVGDTVRGLRLSGRGHRVIPARNGKGRWQLRIDGRRIEAEVLDRGQEAIRAAKMAAGVATGPAPLEAPMPGLVLRIDVEVGDEVTEGQGVAIVEAMKMENELTAAAAARVSAIHVAEGEAVEKGQTLVEFEPLDDSDPEEDEG
jgi:biotin carboxyl carrier protein